VPKKLFEKILEKGKSYHAAHFSLRVSPLDKNEPSKFTFSIPKKIDARATKRNYLRRKGLALLRPHLNAVPMGIAGIFFAKSDASSLTTAEFEQEIAFLISKLNQLS
jgi:ribonuclease P protein component